MAPSAQSHPEPGALLASALHRTEEKRGRKTAVDLTVGESKLLPTNVLRPAAQEGGTQEQSQPEAPEALEQPEQAEEPEVEGVAEPEWAAALPRVLEQHLLRQDREQARRHEEILAQLRLLQVRQRQQHLELLRQFESSHESAKQGRESVVQELQQQQERRQQQEERWQQLLEPQRLVTGTSQVQVTEHELQVQVGELVHLAPPLHTGLRRSLPEYISVGTSRPSQPSQALTPVVEPSQDLEPTTAPEPQQCTAVVVLGCGSMVVALLGPLIAGVDAELGARAVELGEAKPRWLWWARLLLATAFTAELALRAVALRRSFTRSSWNWLELALLLSAWAGCALDWLDLTVLRVFTVLRICALQLPHVRPCLRLSNALVVRQLQVASAALVGSCSTLCCAVVLALAVLYTAAVVFLQLIGGHYYGSVQRTMASLAMALLGGLDWEELLGPLRSESPVYAWAFFGFFSSALLVGLSVYIAVFAYTVRQLAECDEEQAAKRKLQCDQKALARLKGQLPEVLTRPALQQLLAEEEDILGLHWEQVLGLWELLESAGSVDREDFMAVLLRLKGSAKAMDVAMVLSQSQQVQVQVNTLMRFVETEFNQVAEDLQRLLHGLPAGDRRDPSTMEEYESQELRRNSTATALLMCSAP